MAGNMMNSWRNLARSLNLPLQQVIQVTRLLDEGNTTPFIARYRRDETGGLGEETIRQIQNRLKKLRLLDERREAILRSLETQDKLTEELARQIGVASTSRRLEDLYLPYRPRKQTAASLARQRGLTELADAILSGTISAETLEEKAAQFVNPENRIQNTTDAINGVVAILAEQYGENSELRQHLRDLLQRTGRLVSKAVEARPTQVEASQGGTQDDTVSEENATSSDSSVSEEVDVSESDGASGESVVSAESDPEVVTETLAASEENAPVHASQTATGEFADTVKKVALAHPTVDQVNVVDTDAVVGETVAPIASESVADTQEPSQVVEASQVVATSQIVGAAQGTESVQTDASQTTVAHSQTVVADHPQSAITAAVVVSPVDAGAQVVESTGEGASGGTTEGETTEGGTTEEAVGFDAGSTAKKAESTKTSNSRKKRKKTSGRVDAEQQRKMRLYAAYADFSEELRRIPPHRVLTIFRGESANFLKVRVRGDVEAMTALAQELLIPADHPQGELLQRSLTDAVTRLILPGLEREARRELAERAELHAVDAFSKNLRTFLLQQPVRHHRVLAIAPGFRQGVKVVALEEDGTPLAWGVVTLFGKGDRRTESRQTIANMVQEYGISLIVVGGGVGCREAEDLVSEVLSTELAENMDVVRTLVSDVGATTYSLSPEAREELSDYDASVRVAISLGRRIQDPLTEYVKTEPSQLGVGLYQYDVRARHLREFLEEAVTACVSQVGLDVNAALPSQLRYIAGLNRLTARKIYDYRLANGPFVNREQLKLVPGLSEQAWNQAIGFLRIYGGDQILDGTPLHPSQYPIAARLMQMAGVDPAELGTPEADAKWNAMALTLNFETLAQELASEFGVASQLPVAQETQTTQTIATAESSEDVSENSDIPPVVSKEVAPQLPVLGPRTLYEIFESLRDPMYDVRDTMPGPIFRRDRLKPEELIVGGEYLGVVQNVLHFGAFVDIGMQDCGLVHVSELADRFVQDPQEAVSVGDVVRVRVLKVATGRVSLTMVSPESTGVHSDRSAGRTGARTERRDRDGGRYRENGRGQDGGRGSEGNRDRDVRREDRRTGGRMDGRSSSGRSDTGRDSGQNRARGGDRVGDRGAGERGSGERREGTRRRERSGGYIGTYVAAAPEQPAKPLSEEVRSGKAPMRSFADLLQFYKSEDSTESAAQTPTSNPEPAAEVTPEVAPENVSETQPETSVETDEA